MRGPEGPLFHGNACIREVFRSLLKSNFWREVAARLKSVRENSVVLPGLESFLPLFPSAEARLPNDAFRHG